jgi:hypothetical protein
MRHRSGFGFDTDSIATALRRDILGKWRRRRPRMERRRVCDRRIGECFDDR